MRNHLLLILFATLLSPITLPLGRGGAMAFAAAPQSQTAYTIINTEDFKKLRDAGTKITVIDARDPEEYHEGHITGAVNIPEEHFSEHLDRLPPDKSAKIVFYCDGITCDISTYAAQRALALGYANILVYAGGITEWKEKGLPVEKP